MASTKQNHTGKTSGSSKKAFAAMDDDKQKEISSKGGKASHGLGTSGRSGKSQADTDEIEDIEIEDNEGEDTEEESGL